MDRRDFLRFSGIAATGFVYPTLAPPAFAQQPAGKPWRTFETTTRVEVMKPVGVTRVWLPVPLARDTIYIRTIDNVWEAEGGKSAVGGDMRYDTGIVWAQWPEGVKPVFVLKSRFSTRDVAVDLSRPGGVPAESPEVLARYTAASAHVPTDGAVKALSSQIVKGCTTDVDKARAIYEWIVDNTYRDPKTRGCGTGDVKFMIENQAYHGKCADLNAFYVALARAEGLPARDVYGIRVADSALGYKSLGKSGDITKAQHCRAEVYLAGYGWVPVDPADVRKVILEEEGGKPADDPKVVAARKRLFGSWEMNWLAYNYANDIALPGSDRGAVPFLMYPQCETAEGRLDSLDADNFKYQITVREITA